MTAQNTKMPREKMRKPLALSLEIKLSFPSERGPVATGWYADGMPVLLYRTEEDEYVAKCLPFNQLGMGDSAAKALGNLVAALHVILEDAIENRYLEQLTEDINNGVGRPGDSYWKKYAEAVKAQSESKKRIRLPRRIITDRMTATPQHPIDLRTLRTMRRQFLPA